MKDVDFWLDEYVNRYRLSPRYFKDIFRHIKDNIKEGEKEEDVNANLKILSEILKDVLDDSRKRKVEDPINCRSYKAYIAANGRYCDVVKAAVSKGLMDVEGDRLDKVKKYCNWIL